MSDAPFLRLGLLGHPLGHTLSPALHTFMLQQVGRQGFYVPLDTPRCAQAMAALRELDFHGLNVTVPHKLTALENSVDASETARLIGAANTLVPCTGGWAAHNTDGEGLLMSLRETFGHQAPQSALMLGAGGAARGALWALAAWGVKDVLVLNRSVEKADALKPLAAALGLSLSTGALTPTVTHTTPLVVQTTTVGMSPDDNHTPARLSFSPGMKVVDLIYRPRPTLFLREAADAGADTLDGLAMLVYQAWLAFKLWTGTAPEPGQLLKHAGGLLASGFNPAKPFGWEGEGLPPKLCPVKKRLADILLEQGQLTETNLLRVKEIAKQRDGVFLGKILEEEGLVTPEKITEAIGLQMGVWFVDVSKATPDPVILKKVSVDLCRSKKLLPLEIREDRLLVAMVNPMNLLAIDEVEEVTGTCVFPLIANESALAKALDWWFGST